MELLMWEDGTPAMMARGQFSYSSRRRTRVEELQAQLARLADCMRIAVIFGGDKRAPGAVINPTHNPRSWKSYESVAHDIAAALGRIGFRHVTTLPDDMRLGERLQREGIHLAWLNTGGVQGIASVGHASALLEMLGVPYVGHNPLSAATLDNKNVLKRDLVLAGIPTASFMVWQRLRGPLDPNHNPTFRAVFGDDQGPFVVKPVSGRASLNVLYVESVDQLDDAVDEVHAATEAPLLIERYLSGREYCVAVCGEIVARQGQLVRCEQPFAFAAVERVLDRDEHIFTSMDHRPITVDRLRLLDPATEAGEIDELNQLARRIYCEFEVETLIRLDVRADQQGRMFVLEANPKPDLAAPTGERTSIVARGLRAEGMTYDDLILSLLADRIDILFTERRSMVSHLGALLQQRAGSAPRPGASDG